jgi:hypothetical protein
MINVMAEIKGKRNEKAVRLSAQLGEFIQGHFDEEFSRGIRLQNAWETIAGPQVLLHTDNVVFSKKNKQGILIYVENSHWAADLSTQKELYRILLERETGWVIPDIEFLVTRKVSLKKFFKERKEKEKKNSKKRIAIPLNKTEDGYTRELVATVKDKRLRERLYKAIKADFEWKKGRGKLKLSQKPPEGPESI